MKNKKFTIFLIPILCLVAAISILYARPLMNQNLPSQSSQPHTTTPLTDNMITIHYHERAPYYITGPLDVYGLCSDPVKFAFKKAGIKFQWKKTPAKRQLDIIRGNRSNDCLVGWFKNAEREKFARFSHYIYQDKPFIAIARADNHKILSNLSLTDILLNPQLVLLKKNGYSYGHFIDAKIKKINPNQETTNAENVGMLKMIHSSRADYFFISQEEAITLTGHSGLPKTEFKFIYFSDMPQGNKRYLIFSKRVDKKTVEKINTAIKMYLNTKA